MNPYCTARPQNPAIPAHAALVEAGAVAAQLVAVPDPVASTTVEPTTAAVLAAAVPAVAVAAAVEVGTVGEAPRSIKKTAVVAVQLAQGANKRPRCECGSLIISPKFCSIAEA